MVLAYHIIFTAYGFWLPNDPRGSWSDYVRNWDIAVHGNATKTDVRHSVAHTAHDRQRRLNTKSALRYSPIQFTGRQALQIAKGFTQAITESKYEVWACSILPAHVHMVVRRHEQPAEKIIGHFKARAAQHLVAAGMHPFAQDKRPDGRFPSVWAHRAWKVFLNSPEEIERSIGYVEGNPIKDGKKPQRWSFVTRYPGVRRI